MVLTERWSHYEADGLRSTPTPAEEGSSDFVAAPARSRRRRGPLTRLAVSRQRRVWTKRAPSWGRGDSPDLRAVVEVVLASIPLGAIDVLEVGCADGAVALPLARRGARVLAVDVSPAMTARLREKANSERLENVAIMTAPIEGLELQPASLDVVVSNYVLHHLRDKDKASFVRGAATWLRPGGCLVVGDMMLGRGVSGRDRRIIRRKVVTLARKGPGGWWRIVKNSIRFLLRVHERALPIGAWMCLLEDAGFTEVTARSVVAEAGIVTGVLPARPAPDPMAPARATGFVGRR